MTDIERMQDRVESLQDSVEIRDKALRIREQEAQRKKKDDNDWNMGQIVSMLVLVSGLMLLIQIRTMFPLEHLNHVVDVFTLLWAISNITFCGVFGTSRTMKKFSSHVERLIYMCFSLFVLYALYLISRPVGTSPGASVTSIRTNGLGSR